jgi:iron(III) transport system substrate-binding protein
MEYPANPNVAPHPMVSKWGTFRKNTINVGVAGQRQIEAVQLMDRAGYK